jgi:hypothetical protein
MLADDDLPVEMVCPAEGLRGFALDSFPDTQNQKHVNRTEKRKREARER